MKIKRVVALFCVITLLLSSASVSVYADETEVDLFAASASELVTTVTNAGEGYMVKPTKTTDMLWDSFEDGDASDWYLRNTNEEAGRKAEILKENDNNFLRFSLTGGVYPNTWGEVDLLHPVLSRSFAADGAVKVDMNNISVFEIDVRTSAIDSNVGKMMMFNYPYRGETLPDGTAYSRTNAGLGERGWNTRVQLLLNTAGKVSFTNRSGWSNGGNQGGYTNIADSYYANEWYKVRYVYNNTATPRTASVYMYDSNGALKGSVEDVELSAWWYTHYDMDTKFPITNYEIYDISLRFDMPVNESNNASVDIDNLKLFTQKPTVRTAISSNTDIGILYKPTEVSLSFDAPINYTDGGIEIHDSLGNPVAHSGSYDIKSRTYKAVFDGILPGGNYTFEIMNTVTPVNATEGKIANINFAATSIPFMSYDAMPPAASDVEVEGRIIPGEELTATYEFVTESGLEEGSTLKWFKSETGEEGTFTEIIGFTEKTLDVTAAGVYGSYVQFSVTPRADNGLTGPETFSNIIIPEAKPIAKDLKLSTQNLFPGFYVSPVYEFVDANDDDYESGTVVEWYKSNDGENNWVLIDTVERYKVTEDDMGFYLKCKVTPKSNSVCEHTGDTYESEVAGPVSDLLESTNLFVDPGFENSAINEYWMSQPTAGSGWRGISITDSDAHTGERSLRQPPRIANNDTWRQYVPVTANNIYLLGCYAKKANDKLPDTGGLWPYPGTSGLDRYDLEYNDYTYTVTRRWQLCVGSFLATQTRDAGFTFVSFETIKTLDALFDDMYVAELMVTDIETFEPGDITIPQGDDVSYKLTSEKVLNQLGTIHGLKDQVVLYEYPETDGVKVEDGNLIVSNKAKAGRLNIKLYCIPTYPGADQDIFEKYVTVNLVPNNDTSPKAYEVTASGNVATGSTLTGDYKFYQIESKNDASTFQWTYCDTVDGTYEPIPGATAKNYTVESAYADKYIKFSVTPKTDDGMVGETAYSNFVTIPRVPVASDVVIDGDYNVGGTLTATYTFYDPNGDNEAPAIYNWMIADSANSSFNAISGASGNSLVLTEEMIGKYIKVGVSPVSDAAPATGEEVYSDVVMGPAVPQAIYVSIENNNGRLEGHYIYSHPHNTKEKGTTFEWKVDGTVVSDKIDYVPSFSGAKTVTFTVTPKSEGNPSVGNSVSVSATIGNAGGNVTGGFVGGVVGGFVGGGGSGGGYGGGGGASSGSGAGVTNINDMNLVDPNAQPETPKSDIDEHWGKEYIEEMAERGVMSADENGNYNPDINVTREEMVTFLFDALGLEASTYENQFGDVEEGEFADKLQTMLNNGTIAKDTEFRPDDTISREEMCKILYVSLENAGKLAEVEEGLINSFADYDGISEWARVYVNAIYGNKIMVGVSDTEFDAKGTVTKAQAATMLVRILALTEVE